MFPSHDRYGKTIVSRLLELAECADCYKVILHCSLKNMPFYESLGFSHFTPSNEDDKLIGMRIDKEGYTETISGS